MLGLLHVEPSLELLVLLNADSVESRLVGTDVSNWEAVGWLLMRESTIDL